MASARMVGAMAYLLAAGLPATAGAATEAELQSAVFRAKPAVVMIAVRVGATATVRCSTGPPAVVRPGTLGELGSGSIIHPDGWIVTNGHVVQPYQEGADGSFAAELLERAVASACAAELDDLSAPVRTERIRALTAQPDNRGGLVLERSLEVRLSNGKAYPAAVKFYSPPAYVVVGPRNEHGRDVAILKVEDKELPVVRLARHSTDLHLGQALFVIGFPGVVASHELLSKSTRYEPSITTGRVSGFRDLHYRAYRNMSAADRIHPGFPDVERVREDCDIKHKEQGYLHREEVQWAVMGALLVAVIAGVSRRPTGDARDAGGHSQHRSRGARRTRRTVRALSVAPGGRDGIGSRPARAGAPGASPPRSPP